MKKAILIVATPFTLLLVLTGAFWWYMTQQQSPLTKPPEHGVCFTLEVAAEDWRNPEATATARKAITRRFQVLGARTFWEPVSATQFRVYAPLTDPTSIETASGLVSERGLFEFRLVHPASQDLLNKDQGAEGYELLKAKPGRRSNYRDPSYLVSKTAEGGESGIKVQQATAARESQTGRYHIYFKLASASADNFKKITRDNIGRQLAIVMDDTLLSAPVIRSEIADGAGVISGQFDRAEAVRIASLMEAPLPIQVRLLDTKTF